MKNKFLNIVGGLLLFAGISTNAQVLTNANVVTALTNSNFFMDASNFEGLANTSYGRGMGFPRTNLTTFQFDTAPMDNTVILSDFDGMVVYNSTAGTTPATGSGIGNQTLDVGFYYFSNPGNPGNITNGRWLPIGGNSRVDIGTAETVTNTLVNGNQVYARRGTFTTNGTSTAPTAYSGQIPVAAPGSLYRITIYQSGTNNVYSNSVYSYDATGTFITGSPSMSVVYPAGTYNYTVEYTKTNTL